MYSFQNGCVIDEFNYYFVEADQIFENRIRRFGKSIFFLVAASAQKSAFTIFDGGIHKKIEINSNDVLNVTVILGVPENQPLTSGDLKLESTFTRTLESPIHPQRVT